MGMWVFWGTEEDFFYCWFCQLFQFCLTLGHKPHDTNLYLQQSQNSELPFLSLSQLWLGLFTSLARWITGQGGQRQIPSGRDQNVAASPRFTTRSFQHIPALARLSRAVLNSECKCQIKRGCGQNMKLHEGLLKDVFFICFIVWGIFCTNFVPCTQTPPTAKIMTLWKCVD